MICDLCEKEFNQAEGRSSCSGCGSKKTCGGIRCPHCYYEMIPEPKWLTGLKNFLGLGSHRPSSGEEDPSPHEIPLVLLDIGARGEITNLHARDEMALRKMIAMGALPGQEVTLIQKFPSYVFEIGHSRFSVDQELAVSILTKRK